ncbi:MAG: hypothetical protein JO129_03225 [Candidatus Dependentiae bacterium]|nr:hypothetical protein [Candidatus Dependentiae bacterium]
MKNRLHFCIVTLKLLFLSIIFQIEIVAAEFESAGKARVFYVMHKGFGGIEQLNKNIIFAETRNLNLDLNLLEISSRFGCQTQIGKEFIALFLEKVVSPKDKNDTIKNRRKLIQLLIENPHLQVKFEQLMQEAIKHEAVVMEFMQKREYYIYDPLSDNILDTTIHFIQRNQYINAVNHMLMASVVYFAAQNLDDKFKKYYSSFSNATLSERVSTVGKVFFNVGDAGWEASAVASTTWGAITSGYALYKHYKAALNIRDSLYSLNRLIDIAKQIEDICRQYGVEHQFKLSSIRSEKGINLLNGLNQDRYSNKDDCLVLTPMIHSFVYDVYENDIELAPVYASIAEMDAYVALAKKMIELQDEDHTFCFVQFLDAPEPVIHATGFWNILISTGNIVVNNITEDKNIILTGSNEGGKTTTIRAILQNIVLAQTFGIAAASEFKLTQFDAIHSYLNISDDILQGKSRFASELKQAQDILFRVKSLLPHEKLFFALDELFTGTNGEDGAECAYRFIDNIASFHRIQFIYATHFNKLKTIGATNKACVNYKIEPPLRDKKGEFIRDQQGQLIYPYRLSLGINDVNVAMNRAIDAGIFA